jgi:hypothetical protein
MMLKTRRCYTIGLLLVAAVFLLTPPVHGEGYKGFLKLNPDECAPLDNKIVLQLPAEWHKYGDFIKICGLAQKKGQPAKVSIISIWADDYYEAQSPDPVWEDFPMPLIVDSSFHRVGQLPEIYPSDPPRWLNVYYGKWQWRIPAEIRVDVENPAVTGDYYYDSLIWNKNKESYQMRTKERAYGRRHK